MHDCVFVLQVIDLEKRLRSKTMEIEITRTNVRIDLRILHHDMLHVVQDNGLIPPLSLCVCVCVCVCVFVCLCRQKHKSNGRNNSYKKE